MKIKTLHVSLDSSLLDRLLTTIPKDIPLHEIAFLDIETTGLSRRYESVYLVGILTFEQSHPVVRQYLAQSTADEPELLMEVLPDLQTFSRIYSFNGDTFDLPFLRERLKMMHIPNPEPKFTSIDLYHEIRPFAPFLQMPDCKLKTVETYLGIDRQDELSGGELIEIFYEYSRTDDEALERTLLLHNYEDLLYLPRLLLLTSFIQQLKAPSIFQGSIAVSEDETRLTVTFSTSVPFELNLCTSFPCGKSEETVSLCCECHSPYFTLTLPLCRKALRYYLPDYRNYYVLPSGNLMHKSLGNPPQKRTATRKEAFLSRDDLYLPVPSCPPSPALHFFQQEYSDKSGGFPWPN